LEEDRGQTRRDPRLHPRKHECKLEDKHHKSIRNNPLKRDFRTFKKENSREAHQEKAETTEEKGRERIEANLHEHKIEPPHCDNKKQENHMGKFHAFQYTPKSKYISPLP
jgi:bisphosphoglycerate-dependent phosphoglycerate mutase